MKQRRFTLDDQMAFAELSGDYNPLHIDPVTARRLIVGRPVVHGIHALFWALDDRLGGHTKALDLCAVKADFLSAIGVEEEVSYSVNREGKNCIEIELVTEGAKAAQIWVDWTPSKQQRSAPLSTEYPERCKCRVLSADEAATGSGSLDLYLKWESAAKLFPNLIRILPSVQVAEILATTRLVGMECPGLHSMYSGLDLVFSGEADGSRVLTYDAANYDARFSLLSMKVQAPGMKGTIKAFVRPAPQKQVGFRDLRGQVGASEFADQHGLIIGGSRGLGEVTAKLLAAGGAEVRITYYRGSKDAHRVVEEIALGGGSADCLAFDILDPPQDLADRLGEQWVPTHLYYFATPFIFVATRRSFSPGLFQKFCDYYVTGFLNTVQTIRNLGADLHKIFYPSSVSINELPRNMGEYAAAKMAGEIVCDFLEKTNPGIKIHKPRLPRMATDQTASFLPVKNMNPVPTMLQNLRYLRDA